MDTIKQDIKSKDFKPVYLLSGEETYLTRQFAHKLSAAIADGDEMNVHRFQEKNPDIKEMISLADTLPFFASYRLIIVENSGFFKNGCEELEKYLPDLPESTRMIFLEDEVDKRKALYKTLKKIGGYHAEINRQTTKDLTSWVVTYLGRDKIRLKQSTLDYFFETVGTDMNQIKNELDKLISYVGPESILTTDHIDALCVRQVEGKIFDMIDAMSVKNRKLAFSLYHDLTALREPSMRILFLITRQYMQLLQVKEMSQRNMSEQQIAKAAGLHPYVAKKIAGKAKRFSYEELHRYIRICGQMDESIKTGLINDETAVEILITDFSA